MRLVGAAGLMFAGLNLFRPPFVGLAADRLRFLAYAVRVIYDTYCEDMISQRSLQIDLEEERKWNARLERSFQVSGAAVE